MDYFPVPQEGDQREYFPNTAPSFCRYAETCTRRNIEHFKVFRHPFPLKDPVSNLTMKGVVFKSESHPKVEPRKYIKIDHFPKKKCKWWSKCINSESKHLDKYIHPEGFHPKMNLEGINIFCSDGILCKNQEKNHFILQWHPQAHPRYIGKKCRIENCVDTECRCNNFHEKSVVIKTFGKIIWNLSESRYVQERDCKVYKENIELIKELTGVPDDSGNIIKLKNTYDEYRLDQNDSINVYKVNSNNDIFIEEGSITNTEIHFGVLITLKQEYKECKLIIANMDCVELARLVSISAKEKYGDNYICLLNMANDSKPGGGYMKGARAQEEMLFRRSSLPLLQETLENRYINKNLLLSEHRCVVVKDVDFFRKTANCDYEFETPVKIDVLFMAAINTPNLSPQNEIFGKELESTQRRIEMIFKVAIIRGYKAICLGALGCGAFNNPPRQIASIFKKACDKYGKYFREIFFAILEDHNSKGEGNLKPFIDIFSFTENKRFFQNSEEFASWLSK